MKIVIGIKKNIFFFNLQINMASAMTSTLISEAASVQKILHGIICVYKPAGWGLLRVSKELKNKICSGILINLKK